TFKTAISCWYYGIIIYALLSLPIINVPTIYCLSLVLCITASIPVLIIFYLLLLLCQQHKVLALPNSEIQWIVLPGSLLLLFIGVVIYISYFHNSHDIKNYGYKIYLPIAAICSSIFAILINRKKIIFTLFKNSNDSILIF